MAEKITLEVSPVEFSKLPEALRSHIIREPSPWPAQKSVAHALLERFKREQR